MVTQPVTADVSIVGITVPYVNAMSDHMDTHDAPAGLMEFAGRNCYLSFDKPNPATADIRTYILNIIKQKHYSVLEHIQCSFYITGVSRNFTHELVRHRHFSFSELSGRYVDPLSADLGYVIPPAVENDVAISHILDAQFCNAEDAYAAILGILEEKGIKGKKAREAARSVMPGSLETRIVVSGNVRSWMEFISKRDHEAADAEMQRVAKIIYDLLMFEVPEVFSPDVREEWDEEFSQGIEGYSFNALSGIFDQGKSDEKD